MRDKQVRSAFHKSILQEVHLAENTFVLDEFGLKNGQSRADIAVLNGKFVGYEIKTNNDTLNRLSSQVVAYGEVFDEAFVVTGKKHLDKVIQIVPIWWGIYVIDEGEQYNFHCLRDSQMNHDKNGFGLAQLLWKGEVIDILSTILGMSVKQNIDKHSLYNVLVGAFDIDTLTSITINYLKKREGWRTSLKSLS